MLHHFIIFNTKHKIHLSMHVIDSFCHSHKYLIILKAKTIYGKTEIQKTWAQQGYMHVIGHQIRPF